MMKVTVLTGTVKWMPQGSGKDKPSSLLKQGDSVELVSTLPPPKEGKPGALPAPPSALRDYLEAEMKADKAAPAIGSASSRAEGDVGGTFKIETDETPFLCRVYYQSYFVEVPVLSLHPVTLPTTDTNAVTAALYGVKAA